MVTLHWSAMTSCKLGELTGTLSPMDKGIRSQALGTPGEGSETTGGVQPLNNRLERPASHRDDEIVRTDGKPSELSGNDSVLRFRRVTTLNDQVGFFASRRGDGQVGLAAAFKIPRAA
jgi:hypothetical protein